MAAADALFQAELSRSFASSKVPVEVTPTLLALARHAVYRIEYVYEAIDDPSFAVDRVVAIDAKRAREGGLYPYPIACGDGKRPYGDRTYFGWDLEDLGIPGIVAAGPQDTSNSRASFTDEEEDVLEELQRKLPLVLQALAIYGEPVDGG